MNKKSKVVKTYGAVHKRRLPVILAVAVILVAAGIIIGMNIYDEYHTYRSSEATEFETTAEEKNGLLLTSETKTLLGKVYAGFTVRDAESGEPIYQCPDLYLVRDLASISWGTEEDSVLLTQKDGSSVTYVRTGDRWEKVSR